MSISIKKGNLFTTSCQTIVNTINCEGVMGAGIALECRLRYPSMFEKYKILCHEHQMVTGKLWLYKSGSAYDDIDMRWVLNFPTKDKWKAPSRMEWVVQGLDKFVSTYQQRAITSIAFPILGGLNGGLNIKDVIALMVEKLSVCSIPIEIYEYTPTAPDELYLRFKQRFLALPTENLKSTLGLRPQYIHSILAAFEDPSICQLNQLAKVNGIGLRTLEKAFSLLRQKNPIQGTLELY